jgi:pimeloyl-ACP methyl ester carboxylesterase
VVVERAGYGWSDDADTPRVIDTVVSETRTALQQAGEEPPYVLLPYSMSGLEALYWANEYPLEVAAIVGLDPAVPPVYAEIPPPRLLIGLGTFVARTGLLRLVPSLCYGSEAISQGHLTDEEEAAYCALLYRRTWSANMLAEVEITQANAAQVAAQGIPDAPLYLFISNGDGVPVPNWVELLVAYAEVAPNGRYELLDVGHYVHNLAAETIAAEIRLFLSETAGERE